MKSENEKAARMRACVMGTLFSLASVFAVVTEARAVSIPLSNTPVSNAVLASLLGSAVTTTYDAPFDFLPQRGSDGVVMSQVYHGAGAALGEYVYLYQVSHFQDSSENKIGGFALPWQGWAPDDLGTGIGTSFYRPNPVLVPSDSGRYVDGGVVFLFSDSSNLLLPGKDSVLIGMVSPFQPGLFPVNVLDTDQEVLVSSVYAPVPVPAALPLFLTGLAGAALMRRRRS